MIRRNGIDVSEHQSSINWALVKDSGIEYAILRTGYGSPSDTQVDKYFYTNLSEAISVGMPIGVYHYGYATSRQEAINEANFCLSILKNINAPYGVWYDVEEQSMFNTGIDNLTEIVNSFCQTVENAGYKAGVYMSSAHAQHYIDMSRVPYYKWIAQYNVECDYPGHYDIWQYRSDGSVNGINGNVDMDFCYTEFIPNDAYEWVFYKENSKWAVKQHGQWIYDKWIKDKDKWYRIDKDGWMIQKGWYKEGNTWYYLNPTNGEMLTGWFWDKETKGWYYFDDQGRLIQDNWHWDDKENSWYYLKQDGKMATNEYVHTPSEMSRYWVCENGKWIK